jgi:anti-sigma B factor antagonist
MKIEPIDGGLALRGELDADTAGRLDVILQEALIDSCGPFVLDLSGLTFMDSGGINELLRTRALLGREERTLVVVCEGGPVRRVIDLVGIADLFTIVPTREAALV